MYFSLCFIILVDELWLHVRSTGDWTSKLNDYYLNYSKFDSQSDNGNQFSSISKISEMKK